METIGERFNSLFPFYLQDTNPSKEEQWIDPKAKALAFIKEELNKLADGVENLKIEGEITQYDVAIDEAVTIIRTQADLI